MINSAILAFFALSSLSQAQRSGEWNFGGEGMVNVTVVAQSSHACYISLGLMQGVVDTNVFVKSVWIPSAGEFPLVVFCNMYDYGLVSGVVRATVYVNGSVDNSVWSPPLLNFRPGLTCPLSWSSANNLRFTTNGGLSNSISVWPCTMSDTNIQFTRVIKTYNRSPTARKVTVGIAADDIISTGNIGPFPFVKVLNWMHPIFFSIYLEPGIYPLWFTVVDTGGSKFTGAAISIDDIFVSKTGDMGWAGSVNDKSNAALRQLGGPCSYADTSLINQQFMNTMRVTPSLIWPNTVICANGAETAYFRYYLHVPPLSNERKFDFHIAGDDQMIIRINGTPLISNYPDSASEISSYNNAVKFSLYLPHGTHRFKFNVVNYSGSFNPSSLIATISTNGSLISATNGNDGKWTTTTSGVNAINCADQVYSQNAGDEIKAVYPSVPIFFINSDGTCASNGVTETFFFTLTVTLPEVSQMMTKPVSSRVMTNLSSTRTVVSIPANVSGTKYVSSGLTNGIDTSSSVSTDTTSALISSFTTNSKSADASNDGLLSLSREWASKSNRNSITSKFMAASTITATSFFTIGMDSSSSLSTDTSSALISSFTTDSKSADGINDGVLPLSRELVSKLNRNAITSKFMAASTIIATSFLEMYLYFIIAAAAIVILSVCLACLVWQRKSKKRFVPDSTVYSLTSTIMKTNSTQMSSTGATTMVGTEMGNSLSIPGYLHVVNGRDFKIGSKLAQGGGGDIFNALAVAVKLQEFGRNIIVKEIRPSQNEQELSLARFYQELSVTSYLQTNKNIVRLLGYSDNPRALILKNYPMGSLGKLIHTRPVVISKRMAHSFVRDISSGLLAMHVAGFVHCDIKSDNVLIDLDRIENTYFCVICDFGITQVVSDNILKVGAFVVANQMGLSLWYSAPEVFVSMRAGKNIRRPSSDIYALGILGMELVSVGWTLWG